MTLKVNLYEAICGFSREIAYLDGCKHLVQLKHGDIVGPNTAKTIV